MSDSWFFEVSWINDDAGAKMSMFVVIDADMIIEIAKERLDDNDVCMHGFSNPYVTMTR